MSIPALPPHLLRLALDAPDVSAALRALEAAGVSPAHATVALYLGRGLAWGESEEALAAHRLPGRRTPEDRDELA